jgi:hypothetical protein
LAKKLNFWARSGLLGQVADFFGHNRDFRAFARRLPALPAVGIVVCCRSLNFFADGQPGRTAKALRRENLAKFRIVG